MSEKRVRATVYMTLKVKVMVGSWQAEQSFAGLHKQAEREAREALHKRLSSGARGSIVITDDPAVMSVVTTEVTP